MSSRASVPSQYFTEDHHACDALWSKLEEAIDAEDNVLERWREFDHALRRHLLMEEEVLFPALEAATGMRGGPTMVMRAEHTQMRALLDQMKQAADSGDFGAILDQGDTLLMLIQQHNVKEEGILYPLADQALAAQWQTLSARLASFEAG